MSTSSISFIEQLLLEDNNAPKQWLFFKLRASDNFQTNIAYLNNYQAARLLRKHGFGSSYFNHSATSVLDIFKYFTNILHSNPPDKIFLFTRQYYVRELIDFSTPETVMTTRKNTFYYFLKNINWNFINQFNQYNFEQDVNKIRMNTFKY